MRRLQIQRNPSRAALLFLAAGLGAWLLAAPVHAVTPAEADTAFNSLNKVYWDHAAKFFRKEEQGSQKADFWFSAQLWDTVMDQYEKLDTLRNRRGNP